MMFTKSSPNSHGSVNLRDVSGPPQVLLMLERLLGHFASQHGGESALMKNIAEDFK